MNGRSNRANREKIPHNVIVRAPGLLPMMYKTTELSEELGVAPRTIVRWTQNGAPFQRDQRGHIWIHGGLFASWVESQRRPRSRREIPPDHGFCFACDEIVRMEDIQERSIAKLTLLTGSCTQCGGKVNRGSSDG